MNRTVRGAGKSYIVDHDSGDVERCAEKHVGTQKEKKKYSKYDRLEYPCLCHSVPHGHVPQSTDNTCVVCVCGTSTPFCCKLRHITPTMHDTRR